MVQLAVLTCDRCTNSANRVVYYGERSERLCDDCAMEEYNEKYI